MKFNIQVVIEDEQGDIKIDDIIQLDKSCESHNTVGLTLSESKQLLTSKQAELNVRFQYLLQVVLLFVEWLLLATESTISN